MKLFGSIRLKIGESILRNKVASKKRKISYSNIGQVKNIGIVWDASRMEDFACLSRFVQKMNDNKTEVRLLGYFPGKNLPVQYTAVRYLSIIKEEELNTFFLPVSGEANNFITRHFDILIDMNFKNLLPLRYLTSLSDAALKVGLFDAGSKNPYFDLMMEIKNPVNVENYLDQIIHYLGMINSEPIQKAV